MSKNIRSQDGRPGVSGDGQRPESFDVRIKRQDGPDAEPYWQRHRVKYEPDMNVTSVLQRIAANAKTADGQDVAPVAWDSNCLEEICGSCTMIVNGKVRQGCTALVDRLLDENPLEIELQPMTKFPVLRDLVVDRSRMFHAREKVQAWTPVDGYYDAGSGPKVSRQAQEDAYPLSKCMTCGCCLEACPQYTRVELKRLPDESDEDFERRKKAAHDRTFIGAHAISQAMLFNRHPTGRQIAGERLDALTEAGGVQICGNAQNCVAVCPKEIPLTRSIAQAGRQTTVHLFTRWFDR